MWSDLISAKLDRSSIHSLNSPTVAWSPPRPVKSPPPERESYVSPLGAVCLSVTHSSLFVPAAFRRVVHHRSSLLPPFFIASLVVNYWFGTARFLPSEQKAVQAGLPVDPRAEEHPGLERLRRDQARVGHLPRHPQPGACFCVRLCSRVCVFVLVVKCRCCWCCRRSWTLVLIMIQKLLPLTRCGVRIVCLLQYLCCVHDLMPFLIE